MLEKEKLLNVNSLLLFLFFLDFVEEVAVSKLESQVAW